MENWNVNLQVGDILPFKECHDKWTSKCWQNNFVIYLFNTVTNKILRPINVYDNNLRSLAIRNGNPIFLHKIQYNVIRLRVHPAASKFAFIYLHQLLGQRTAVSCIIWSYRDVVDLCARNRSVAVNNPSIPMALWQQSCWPLVFCLLVVQNIFRTSERFFALCKHYTISTFRSSQKHHHDCYRIRNWTKNASNPLPAVRENVWSNIWFLANTFSLFKFPVLRLHGVSGLLLIILGPK